MDNPIGFEETMPVTNYQLDFIDSEELFKHVKRTVDQYSSKIDLKAFNQNLIDPIKLMFDSIVYDRTLETIVESEVGRQLDKTNNNLIGYFHQNIFTILGGSEWGVPQRGFDIINRERHIFVEMKNKHNTINSSSANSIFMKMQNQIIKEPNSTCMLVEVIARRSQNVRWEKKVDGVKISCDRIRRVSIDQFYKMVTGVPDAFARLCKVLPRVITDVVESVEPVSQSNTVLLELKQDSPTLLVNLYLLAFQQYEGFERFDIE